MKGLQEKVAHCLEKYPHTRNNDMHLVFAIIWEFMPGEVETINGRRFISTESLKIVREDHVSRIRRKFNEQNKYLPDDPRVKKQREVNKNNWKETVGVYESYSTER